MKGEIQFWGQTDTLNICPSRAASSQLKSEGLDVQNKQNWQQSSQNPDGIRFQFENTSTNRKAFPGPSQFKRSESISNVFCINFQFQLLSLDTTECIYIGLI